MSQVGSFGGGGSGSGAIDTINTISPDGIGNFTFESTDGTVTFTPIMNGLNLSAAATELSLGAFGSSPNANGLTLTGTVLNMQPASVSQPGGVSTTTQTFAGAKTFSTSVSSPSYLLTGSGSGTISILPQAAAGTYNFNLPITAGTSGYFLTSAGGAGSPMTWTQNNFLTSISITGNSGGPLTGSSFTFTGGSTGLTFSGGGTTETLIGTLVLANGGTSASLTASNGGIFYSTAAAGAILAGTATARQMLQSGASTTPAWSTTTWPATTTANQILYSSATSVIGEITTVANGVLITDNSSVPQFLPNSGTAGFMLTANAGAPPSWQAAATSGTVTSVSVVSANGFAGTVATATSTPAITLSTTITGVLSGNGTAITGSAVTQHGVVVAGASNDLLTVAPSTSGNVLTSNGTDWTSAALPTSAIKWNNVTGTSASMVTNNGYLANNVGLVTLTLPTTCAVLDIIAVQGTGAGGWTLAQGAGQSIVFNAATSTVGATGSVSSTSQNDSLYLMCTTANTTFTAMNGFGNYTIV